MVCGRGGRHVDLENDGCGECRRGNDLVRLQGRLELSGRAIHPLLIDYHFGFTKRALIGFLVSLAFPVISAWSPFLLGGLVLALTAAAFLWLFHKSYGLSEQTLPLLIFTAGSPFFLKKLIQTLGYYDIYGCLLAILLLLLPARSIWYLLAAALGSAMLILIHHILMLLYVPLIILIVATRMRLSVVTIGVGVALLLGLCALFFAAQFAGTLQVPRAELLAYLQSRMTNPDARLTLGMFFSRLAEERASTMALLPVNLSRVPVYLIILALHLPLARVLTRQIGDLQSIWRRNLVTLGIAGISVAYLVVAAIAYDYSRWVSNWSVCMILLVMLTRVLPRQDTPRFTDGNNRQNRMTGWAVSLLPRIGTTIPF
jgi:hypothetical protein